MNERDITAADDWMRDHLPDAAEYSLEDSEEAGSTESYFFLRVLPGRLQNSQHTVVDGARGEASDYSPP